MIMVSSSLPWINGSLPINASFGQMLSNALSVGSKPIGLIGSLFAFLVMVMWFVFANLSLDGIISHVGSLGSGTHLIMGGIIIALIAILLPQLHSKDG